MPVRLRGRPRSGQQLDHRVERPADEPAGHRRAEDRRADLRRVRRRTTTSFCRAARACWRRRRGRACTCSISTRPRSTATAAGGRRRRSKIGASASSASRRWPRSRAATMFTINGAGTGVFDRIHGEISGYYLLGVEPDRARSRRQGASIRIEVPWNGAVVRARRQLLNLTPPVDRRSPTESGRGRAQVAAADGGAAGSCGDIRAAGTGDRQGADADSCRRRPRLQRAAARGARLLDPRSDRQGGGGAPARKPPAAGDERRAVGAAVCRRREPRAGRIHAALAAAEGERAGSVEHRFTARLSPTSGG